MKIAYIVDTFPQLSETFILNQIRGLMQAGYDIDIYTNRVNRETMRDESVVDITEGCNIIQHPVMPKNPLSRIIKALCLVIAGVRTGWAPVLKTMNIFKYGADAYTFRLLYLYLRFRSAPEYDIVHCSHGNYGLLIDYLWQMGVVQGKIIASFRGRDISKFVKENGTGVYHDLFQNGALFLPVCENFKKLLIEYGCPEEKIKVHRSGIELQKYTPGTRRDDVSRDSLRMVSIGRLVEKKGFIYSVKAVEQYVQRNPGRKVRYTIIGSGPLYNELSKYIKKTKMDNVIKLAGPMPHDSVVETMEEADIVINCSVTARDGDIEGIPNVLKEAMAMGIPVISTYHSGIPELIKDGDNGFLIPERDVDGICDKISFIIDNRDLIKEISGRTRLIIEKEYDINKLNKELLCYYDELIRNSRI